MNQEIVQLVSNIKCEISSRYSSLLDEVQFGIKCNHKNYDFSFWVQTIASNNPATLRVTINGTNIGFINIKASCHMMINEEALGLIEVRPSLFGGE